jgi:hypothetical protein
VRSAAAGGLSPGSSAVVGFDRADAPGTGSTRGRSWRSTAKAPDYSTGPCQGTDWASMRTRCPSQTPSTSPWTERSCHCDHQRRRAANRDRGHRPGNGCRRTRLARGGIRRRLVRPRGLNGRAVGQGRIVLRCRAGHGPGPIIPLEHLPNPDHDRIPPGRRPRLPTIRLNRPRPARPKGVFTGVIIRPKRPVLADLESARSHRIIRSAHSRGAKSTVATAYRENA